MTQTLDKPVQVKNDTVKRSKVVNTGLKLLQDFDTVQQEKESAIKRSKDHYMRSIDGKVPNRIEQQPSFILNQLVEIYSTFVRVPDVQIRSFGKKEAEKIIMSKYLEKVVKDGGFNELMEHKWGGYKQQALFGDFFVQCGYKADGKSKGMPVYRGLSVSEFYTTPTASAIRSKTQGEGANRIGVTFTYGENEIENVPILKGITKVAQKGDLPSLNIWSNETDQKTDLQKSEAEKTYQVLFLYDIRHKVYSIIAGSNAFEWKTFKSDKYPFEMILNGDFQPFAPVAHLGLYAKPEGIFHSGFGEMFFKDSYNLTRLESGVMNTAIDNRNAPAILNIPNVDAEDLFAQVDMAERAMEEGENAFIVPGSSEDDLATKGGVGRGNIDYLKRENNIEELTVIKDNIVEDIRRFGWNLDAFFNQQDTARQSELDLVGQNQTVSKFQAQNYEFYKFVYDFAVDAIVKFGDENDDTIFGEDISLPRKDGQTFKLNEGVTKEAAITIGDVVKMFKDTENIEVEIDTKNGFVHNPLLEQRGIQRLLATAIPGSPAAAQLQEALAVLEGQSVQKDDFQVPQDQVGAGATPSQPLGIPEDLQV